MKISKKGIDLIKSFEGFEPKMYLDSAGLPTIGYGTLIDEADEKCLLTATINEVAAESLLINDVSKYEARIAPMIKVPLSQNQYDAIISFAYNVGTTALRKSTLLTKINIDPNDPTIESEFTKWVFAGGKKIKGLMNRRLKEAELYSS
jgi:lysozyme